MARCPEAPGTQTAGPWYRHAYVWLLIAFPAASVAGGLVMLLVAVQTNDGLVVDDYYRQGMEINRRMERDLKAQAAGLEAAIELVPGRIRVALSARGEFYPPGQLELSFMHPTRSGLDRTIILSETTPMIYEGRLPQLEAVRWYALIEADDWRLLDSIDLR